MDKQSTPGLSIEIKNLYKIFGPHAKKFVSEIEQGMTKEELNQKHDHVLGLKNINLTMPAGGIQVIMGLSGSGKSTLLRHINRLIEPTSGSIEVDGVDVTKLDRKGLTEFRRHSTAMVFQNFALLPHRTVLENVVYGLEIQKIDRSLQEESAKYWIDRVGLSGFENNYPNQLSGGMQQRVGLARALTNDAPILLMDEAFSALDPLIRVDMQTILLELQEEIRKTIVFITHDLSEALRLGDNIAILRDGEVIQEGTPQDIVLNPASEYIERFVQEVDRSLVIRLGDLRDSLDQTIQKPKVCLPAKMNLNRGIKRLVNSGNSHIGVLGSGDRYLGALSIELAVRKAFGGSEQSLQSN